MSLLRQYRSVAYRSARRAGDVDALLSGNPRRIAKRGANKLIGRALGRMFLR